MFEGYGRRREPLDDSDYTPDFFGIQCPPPYEDPPPPYTPPKPAPGEAPPPYDAIDSSRNGEIDGHFDQNCNSADLETERCMQERNASAENDPLNSGLVNSSTRHSRNNSRGGNRFCAINNEVNGNNTVINENLNNFRQNNGENRNSFPSNRIMLNMGREGNVGLEETQLCGSAIGNGAVHFRNNSCVHPCITMGIQNRNRNHRNRFSDIAVSSHSSPAHSSENRNSLGSENTRALNLELHNVINNLRSRGLRNSRNQNNPSSGPGELSSSTTDIGESTTSAESLTSSPESPNFDTDNTVVASGSNNDKDNTANNVSVFDADSTVKRFLDRHFGGATGNGRRYPTTMSQSWTSSQSSTPSQNFKQSVSMCAFPACGENLGHPVVQNTGGVLANLPRSKSEHLKTNGSLINQPFNGHVPPKPQIGHIGRGARVAYKDADEITINHRPNGKHTTNNEVAKSGLENRNETLEQSFDTDAYESASNVSSLTAAILDPGEIIVTKRQDELRKLRLSHLLNQPYYENSSGNQSTFTDNARLLHRSLSENSIESSNFSFSPVNNERTNAVLGNDAQYPTNCLQSSAVDKTVSDSRRQSFPSEVQENSCPSQVSRPNSDSGKSSVHGRETSSSNPNSNQSTPRRKAGKPKTFGVNSVTDNAMVHSWHAGVSDNNNDKIVVSKMNTLGRNVNSNFEKKTCGDKDVIKMLFPHYKETNLDTEITDRTFVPSSEMRASASQRYNYETEERSSKRDRHAPVFKRHSTGCFPTKHEAGPCSRGTPMKTRSTQDRQLHQRPTDHVSDRRRSSSRDRKCSRRPMSYERDNSLIMLDSHKKQSDLSHPYLMHSAIPKDFSLLDRGIPGLFNSKPSHSQTKSDKRSKSLGRNEGLTNRKSAADTSSGSTGRKKKSSSRQPNPFHVELEHVLERQSSRNTSPSKSSKHLYNNVDRANSAITQV